MRQIPDYSYLGEVVCPRCGKVCEVIALQNEFSYSATHCTHGLPGIHYPHSWGDPVSDCCGMDIEIDYIDEELNI